MNPYDFVPLDLSNPPRRHRPLDWRNVSGLRGVISGTVTAETPILICDGRSENPIRFMRLSGLGTTSGKAFLPGSSLKGLIRSVVETVAPGCWWRSGESRWKDAIPNDFRACTDRTRLCPACRLFGFLGEGSRSSVSLGAVRFQDAVAEDEKPHPASWVGPLESPKHQHRVWYFPNGSVAGRKFYFHHVPIFLGSDPGRGKRVEPLGVGTTFRFSARFDNVEQDDLDLLLYALTLEPNLRHKMSYGKPVGLGSVRVAIDHIEFHPALAAADRTRQRLEGVELGRYLDQHTERFRARNDPTLSAFRRIWHWPPAPGVTYRYPSREWFRAHPTAPLAETGAA